MAALALPAAATATSCAFLRACELCPATRYGCDCTDAEAPWATRAAVVTLTLLGVLLLTVVDAAQWARDARSLTRPTGTRRTAPFGFSWQGLTRTWLGSEVAVVGSALLAVRILWLAPHSWATPTLGSGTPVQRALVALLAVVALKGLRSVWSVGHPGWVAALLALDVAPYAAVGNLLAAGALHARHAVDQSPIFWYGFTALVVWWTAVRAFVAGLALRRWLLHEPGPASLRKLYGRTWGHGFVAVLFWGTLGAGGVMLALALLRTPCE